MSNMFWVNSPHSSISSIFFSSHPTDLVSQTSNLSETCLLNIVLKACRHECAHLFLLRVYTHTHTHTHKDSYSHYVYRTIKYHLHLFSFKILLFPLSNICNTHCVSVHVSTYVSIFLCSTIFLRPCF